MKNTAHQMMKIVRGICQNLSDTTANTAIIDRKGFEELLVILSTGVFSGTSPSLDVKIQEGEAAAMGDAADITGAVFAQVTTANDDATYHGRINLAQSPIGRYLRGVCTIAGTTPVGEYSVTFVLLGAVNKPVTQETTTSFNINAL